MYKIQVTFIFYSLFSLVSHSTLQASWVCWSRRCPPEVWARSGGSGPTWSGAVLRVDSGPWGNLSNPPEGTSAHTGHWHRPVPGQLQSCSKHREDAITNVKCIHLFQNVHTSIQGFVWCEVHEAILWKMYDRHLIMQIIIKFRLYNPRINNLSDGLVHFF